MVARRRHLQRALNHVLAFDVGEVGIFGRHAQRRRLVARQHRVGRLGRKVGADLQQRLGRLDRSVGDQCRLVGVGQRQDEGEVAAVAPGGERHRQRAACRAQLARQRQFAGELVLVQARGGDLFGGGEDTERDRQVEAARFFLQIGGGEVDGDALGGKFEAAVLDGGPHTVLGFFHLRIGQPDDGIRQAVKEPKKFLYL